MTFGENVRLSRLKWTVKDDIEPSSTHLDMPSFLVLDVHFRTIPFPWSFYFQIAGLLARDRSFMPTFNILRPSILSLFGSLHFLKLKKYHFGLHSKHSNLEEKFGDVKFVFMGGSEGRITKAGLSNRCNLRSLIGWERHRVSIVLKTYQVCCNGICCIKRWF